MKVLNAEPFGFSEKALMAWQQRGWEYAESSWAEIESGRFPNVHALIVRLARRIDAGVLNRFPDLRLIVSATTGHDHLDEAELRRRGIVLYSLRPHRAFLETIPSTAEHTWGLLLGLVRHIPAADQAVRLGKWDRDIHRGRQLAGMTIGIVGLGRTGRKVAAYARAFDMRVLYYDPYVEFDTQCERVDGLAVLLRQSQVVSLHVHLNDETRNLLDGDMLENARPDAFLLNTSRGAVWEEPVLATMLRAGRLAGVAADVLGEEHADVKLSPLWQAQRDGYNVVLTPHIGGATSDAMQACEEFIVSTVGQ